MLESLDAWIAALTPMGAKGDADWTGGAARRTKLREIERPRLVD